MAAMMPNSSSSSGTSSSTTVVQQTEQQTGPEQVASEVVRLKLSKPPLPRKKVSWTETTVDNEHMGKKKSKCCCVYVKPRAFDESESDSSDGECDNCSGHVEKRRGGGSQQPPDGGDRPGGGGQGVPAAS